MEEEPAHRTYCQTPSGRLKHTASILGLDHHEDVSITSLVSTSEGSAVKKRMQRLGTERASAPNCAMDLALDEATLSNMRALLLQLSHHSTRSHGYRPEAITENHNHVMSCEHNLFKSTST